MKGLVNRAVLLLGTGAAAAGGAGCYEYRDLVDPCWPQRYNYMARREVNEAFAPQVQNGHVLDQTIWNYHFEAGADKLTAGGLDHLAYLARRRPHPDCIVYLQTAQDVVYDPAAPEKLAEVRQELDAKRIAAVQRFLNAQAAGRGVAFQVLVHDPADVSIEGPYGNAMIQQLPTRSRAGLPSGGGVGGGSGGAGAASPAR
jgi:hypothetical protein